MPQPGYILTIITMLLISLTLLVFSHAVIASYEIDECIEINHAVSNRQLEAEISAGLGRAIRNGDRPQPQFDLPTKEPLIQPLGGRYQVSGKIIDLRNIVIKGLSETQAASLEVVGHGDQRLLRDAFASNVHIEADFSIPGHISNGHLEAIAPDSLTSGSVALAPGRSNIATFKTTSRKVHLKTWPKLPLHPHEEAELVSDVINNAVAFLHRRFDEAVLRSKCDRPHY